MAYVGNTPTTQNFISGTDYFNGTGSQTAFTLSRTVASVNDIQAVVNNVVQVPNDAYTISGTTITFTSAPSAGTQNVYVRYLSTTTQAITPSQNTVSWNTLDSNIQQDLGVMFKNRIINGDMVIDQRNSGASVTPSTTVYTLDRWQYNSNQASKVSVQRNAGSVTPPAGFRNYLGITVVSSYSIGTNDYNQLIQPIEGFNVADLGWGTANAKTVTLSFWVRSSLTGTFGGSLRNQDINRSYAFTFSISAANNWEYKTITVVGDTTGTWITDSGIGLYLTFSMGAGSGLSGPAGAWAGTNYSSATGAVSLVGTNGATFYVTGVQLEVGTQATAFSTAGGSYGAELALCQRYFQRNFQYINGFVYSTNIGVFSLKPWVLMRATPTLGYTSGASNVTIDIIGGVQTSTAAITAGGAYASSSGVAIETPGLSGRTQWQGVILASETLTLSAEL